MRAREPELDQRIGNRDAALRRLRRTSAFALAGTAGLAAAFGGLAARAFPGKSRHTAPVVVQTYVPRASAAATVATPPPLVAAGTAAPAASAGRAAPATPPPSPPPAPPVVTPAAPVAVSGGS
jgi:hypothetical protein